MRARVLVLFWLVLVVGSNGVRDLGPEVRHVTRQEVVDKKPKRDKKQPYVIHCIPGTDINGDGQDDFCTRTGGR